METEGDPVELRVPARTGRRFVEGRDTDALIGSPVSFKGEPYIVTAAEAQRAGEWLLLRLSPQPQHDLPMCVIHPMRIAVRDSRYCTDCRKRGLGDRVKGR